MQKTGIGLKPLIAIQLLVVLGGLAFLLTYAALRLVRHELTLEQVRFGRELLQDTATRLEAWCPGFAHGQGCPNLGTRVDRHRATFSSLLELSLFDPRRNLAASSDAALQAQALWDAFGSRPAGERPRKDWSVWEKAGRRVLVVRHALEPKGWLLAGTFSLDASDLGVARLSRSLFLYASLLLGVMLLLGWMLLYRLIVRPMDRLLRSADSISEGDLQFLLSAERGSELGRLGWSFTRMARRIEEGKLRMQEQILELTRLNRELQQAQQGMIRSEKLASVGRLAAGLAHEVGNPISAILGYVGMLLVESIPEDQAHDILVRVESEVERIDEVIKDLLAYSRPGRGIVSARQPVDLVDDAMALIRPQKKYKQIHLEVEVPADLPAVSADPDLVRQVLVNLLFNALDAVEDQGHIWLRAVAMASEPDGGVTWPGYDGEPPFFELGPAHHIRPPREGRGIDPDGSVVVFAVVDDGPGIEDSDLMRIFDPFFTTKEPGKGTGLGLAICHAGVQAMGGEIWAWSRNEQGTQMAFYLPAAPKGGGDL